MTNTKLLAAREAVAAAQRDIDQDTARFNKVQDAIAALQRQIQELSGQQVSQPLQEALIGAQAELALAEEEAVAQWHIALAAEIMRRQNTDPIAQRDWIVASVTQLRMSQRLGLDHVARTTTHPLILQANALLPPLDALDTPVYLLGSVVAVAGTDWPSRRKRILAEAEAHPLEAA